MQLRSRRSRRGVFRSLPTRVAFWVFATTLATSVAPFLSHTRLGVPTAWLLAGATAASLAAWIAFRIARRSLWPIEQLAEGARRIARGETDVSVPGASGDDEIALLAQTFNQMAARLHRIRLELQQSRLEVLAANASLRERNEELQRANERLEHLSITDGLTGVYNHRYFQEQLTREIRRTDRSEDALALILVDIDDFKALNDEHGHSVGDRTLRGVAEALRGCVRATDLLARYGGEEFVILAPRTGMDGAVAVAEKARIAVLACTLPVDETDPTRRVGVSVSLGVATYRGDRERFFEEADRALYRAKESGKDCVVAGDPAI
jgi:diguanylate cyclase (GGDEF)-like protein